MKKKNLQLLTLSSILVIVLNVACPDEDQPTISAPEETKKTMHVEYDAESYYQNNITLDIVTTAFTDAGTVADMKKNETNLPTVTDMGGDVTRFVSYFTDHKNLSDCNMHLLLVGDIINIPDCSNSNYGFSHGATNGSGPDARSFVFIQRIRTFCAAYTNYEWDINKKYYYQRAFDKVILHELGHQRGALPDFADNHDCVMRWGITFSHEESSPGVHKPGTWQIQDVDWTKKFCDVHNKAIYNVTW